MACKRLLWLKKHWFYLLLFNGISENMDVSRDNRLFSTGACRIPGQYTGTAYLYFTVSVVPLISTVYFVNAPVAGPLLTVPSVLKRLPCPQELPHSIFCVEAV